jgi:hypothetical protein
MMGVVAGTTGVVVVGITAGAGTRVGAGAGADMMVLKVAREKF